MTSMISHLMVLPEVDGFEPQSVNYDWVGHMNHLCFEDPVENKGPQYSIIIRFPLTISKCAINWVFPVFLKTFMYMGIISLLLLLFLLLNYDYHVSSTWMISMGGIIQQLV